MLCHPVRGVYYVPGDECLTTALVRLAVDTTRGVHTDSPVQ